MDRRRALRLVGTVLCAHAVPGRAQQAKLRKIGFLQNTPATTAAAVRLAQAFARALEEHGFVEGRNHVFERRYVEGQVERIAPLADELIRLECDVIVVSAGDRAVRELKARTTTIPIVMAGTSDPVRDGLIASFARPGGNITGVASASLDLFPKQLELLKAAAPGIRRIAFLRGQYGAGDAATAAAIERRRLAAAKALGVELVTVWMPAPQDFADATATVLREHIDALLISPNATNFILRDEIAAFALRRRLPAVAQTRDFAEAGLLLSYGTNPDWVFRTTAGYVARILKGAKPADLPVEQAQFELVINLGTAKALGLAVPDSLRVLATELLP